jgi:hypothetical protein
MSTSVCCAFVDCKNHETRPMVKEGEEYISKDGELYFCEEHNPIMSSLYNQYKALVDWYPTKFKTHRYITINYKFWAIPQALQLRREFASYCKPSHHGSGHAYYEKILHEQFLEIKIIIDSYRHKKRYRLMRSLKKRKPKKYGFTFWEDVCPIW